MDRAAPRTSTNIIAALTALAWVIAAVAGKSEQAALSLGFIPARFACAVSAMASRSGDPDTAYARLWSIPEPVHLGFNLLMFVWCGPQSSGCSGGEGWSSST